MSKYVVDLKDNCNMIQQICLTENGNAYATYVESTYVHYLEELNSDYINEHFGDLQDTAYQKGINDGSLDVKQRVEGAYQKGFEDGKAVNDKGCEGCKYSGTPQGDSPCYNCSNYYQNNWTAKDDKIVVGDEVEVLNSGSKYLIAWIAGTSICGFSHDGVTCHLQPSDVRKTGRHFDIQNILEAIKHD